MRRGLAMERELLSAVQGPFHPKIPEPKPPALEAQKAVLAPSERMIYGVSNGL